MRALRLAAAFLAVLLSPQAWLSVGAASSSTFSLVCGSANAGSDVACTVTRLSGGKGIYVLFQTSDGTAKAGIDYTAVSKLLYLKGSQLSASVAVHTVVNPAATGTLTFTAAIAASSTDLANAQAAIIEPAPPPPTTQTCPDGSIIAASSSCPVAPPPTVSWVSAPLQDGGFARVTNASDSLWPMTGPGAGRPLVNGEIVAVYFNGWGYQADGQASFAIYALSDGASGRALAGDLQGVAPVGTPPGLPANWWVPGLVTANKTCGSATQPGQPGVVQGGTYRAAMLAGSHMKLADGVTGAPSNMWLVFATGTQQYTTGEVVVMGDCLTGLAAP